MENPFNYTFKLGRKCRKCGKPIGDQVHQTRKYCPRKVLPDGSVESCKDDFHTPIRKRNNTPFLKIAKHHKLMHQRLGQLLSVKGDKVTLEDLNLWGIILHRPYQFEVKDGRYIFYFFEFAVSDLGNKQYKIYKHGVL